MLYSQVFTNFIKIFFFFPYIKLDTTVQTVKYLTWQGYLWKKVVNNKVG